MTWLPRTSALSRGSRGKRSQWQLRSKRWMAGFLVLVVVAWCLVQWLMVRAVDNVDTKSTHNHEYPNDRGRLSRKDNSFLERKSKDNNRGSQWNTKQDNDIEKSPAASNTNTTTTKNDNDNFYIVFSTDCSGYQHWQGILLYYSALRVQQSGTLTRIASGCTPEQQEEIAAEFRRIDPTEQRFQVHFAPSTALKNSKYKYSNKPGGLLHWLQHNNNDISNDTVVCLLDPDMILLKPITPQLIDPHWKRQPHGRQQVEYVDSNRVAHFLRVSSLPHGELPTRVSTGYPAGQHFGIGGAWVQGQSASAKPVWKNFSKAFVCGSDTAPCTTTTADDASQLYAVGPVYLATVQDWNHIAATWWDLVPKVHDQYPYLLAEMYALTMAVANLELPFSLFSSYMVTGSEVSSPTEAWAWIDELISAKVKQNTNDDIVEAVCQGIDTYQPPSWTLDPASMTLPNTLHYCQRYKLDLPDGDKANQETTSFLFAKRKIPHQVFSCDDNQDNTAEPVPFDIQDLIRLAKQKQKQATGGWTNTEKRTMFAFCHLVPLLNWARTMYREQVCSG